MGTFCWMRRSLMTLPTDAESVSQRLFRDSGSVVFRDLIHIERYSVHGVSVYNLETNEGAYVARGTHYTQLPLHIGVRDAQETSEGVNQERRRQMLKNRLTKDEHAALPEAVQEHYKAEGDAFVSGRGRHRVESRSRCGEREGDRVPREQPGTECQGDRA